MMKILKFMQDKSINKRSIFLTLGFVCLLLVALLGAISFLYFNYLDNSVALTHHISPSATPTQTQNLRTKLSSDLATLSMIDLGYQLNYPSNFTALNTQEGIEFRLIEGKGKIILIMAENIPQTTVFSDGSTEYETEILNIGAEIIRNSVRPLHSETFDANSESMDRFSNIKFDPKKF